MAHVLIGLHRASQSTLSLTVSVEAGQAPVSLEIPASTLSGLKQGLPALRAGVAPPGAWRSVGAALGSVLFVGAAGVALRDALGEDPDLVLVLDLDEELQSWPWEVIADPRTGRFPVAEGAEIVRLVGAARAHRALPTRGLLLVPNEAGAARAQALESATRHLGRKASIEILPVEPATGVAARRALERGALFAHIDATGPEEIVRLDDGPVPLARLGIGPEVWLTVLGGVEPTGTGPRDVIGGGSALAIGRQTTLPSHLAAAADRELYRALAGGGSVSSAVSRVRRSLSRATGEDGFAWAALTLWSAPQVESGTLPALDRFPPQDADLIATSGGSLEGSSTLTGIAEGSAYPDLSGATETASSAAVFVVETIRRLRAGNPDDAETRGRAAVLRALGASAGALPEADDAGLSPAERTARLADRLVASIGRADVALTAPTEGMSRIARAADRAAADANEVARVAAALLASPVVFLCAPDHADAERLARAVVEEVFEYHLSWAPAGGSATLALPDWGIGPTPVVLESLIRAAALNWRRDLVDPFDAQAPAPATRLSVVARAGGGGRWRLARGSWLALSRPDEGALRDTLRAAIDRAVCGPGPAGRPYRFPLPQDFRLLIIDRQPPASLPASIPVVHVGGPGPREAEVGCWVAAAEARLGAAASPRAVLLRRRVAEQVRDVVTLCRVACAVPSGAGLLSVTHALSTLELSGSSAEVGDAEYAAALDSALLLAVTPWLAHATAEGRAFVTTWLRGGSAAVAAGGWKPADERIEDTVLMRNLAALLDRIGEPPAGRVAQIDELGDAPQAFDARALLTQWGAATAIPPPPADLRGLLRSLH